MACLLTYNENENKYDFIPNTYIFGNQTSNIQELINSSLLLETNNHFDSFTC